MYQIISAIQTDVFRNFKQDIMCKIGKKMDKTFLDLLISAVLNDPGTHFMTVINHTVCSCHISPPISSQNKILSYQAISHLPRAAKCVDCQLQSQTYVTNFHKELDKTVEW